ncbi:Phosphoribosylformylglycinamidine synthase, PurS subunit [hydrothermal vent metagenome]|uniref:Phosphoribosylformylglycinamidine synthase, PurS subunit n=1 Tax=hydrothermal vent metagenome TaxID=652676 RepID=A0A3B0VDQ4_9ZZZZ
MKANVYITLKNGVLDIQGRAVMDALGTLDFKELKDLRIGRFMELELDGANADEVRARVTEMCKSLLANPVIEDYRIEVVE